MSTRRCAFVALLVLALAIPAQHASGQQGPLSIEATLSTPQAMLGERFSLVVTIAHPPDMLVSVDAPTRSETLQLVEVRPTAKTVTAERATSRFEYVLAAFTLGDVQVPPQRVSWLTIDGATGTAEVAGPPINVRPVSPATEDRLRGLKPQLDVLGAPTWWERAAPYAAAALSLAILLGAAVQRWRARPRRALPLPEQPAPAETHARQRLDLLAASDPLSRRDYDAYYGTIAEVVREFLQQRFEFGAQALTTTELHDRMVGLGVERWQARLVSGLLDRCDAAVYAGRHPDPASADHDLTVAFEIIELSRPRQELAVSG